VAEVRFAGVRLDGATALPGCDAQLVARVLQAVRILLSADALGAAQRALAMAVEYAKHREQFGVVIGSFQAVQHLCAEVVAEIDPVQSLLWYAAYAWDQGLPEAATLSALLKAHTAETTTQAVAVTTQVHGGIGFTHECDHHIFYQRVGYARQLFGTPDQLRAEAAALQFPG
jgi:alkylation response protein AidB-like acyl-CoA dehydrogenase